MEAINNAKETKMSLLMIIATGVFNMVTESPEVILPPAVPVAQVQQTEKGK